MQTASRRRSAGGRIAFQTQGRDNIIRKHQIRVEAVGQGRRKELRSVTDSDGREELHEYGTAHFPRGAVAAVLRALVGGARSVSELVEATGLSQPNVSNHLARLRSRGLVDARREGRRVMYQLANAAVARLVAAHGSAAPAQTVDAEAVAADFLQAVLSHHEEEAAKLVEVALARGLPWDEIYLRVFEPALVEVGRRWEIGELGVGAEHLMTGIVLRLMHRLSLFLPVAPDPAAPSAVVACVEGEQHAVGSRMVADFLLARGWRVWHLNGNLPVAALLEAVNTYLPCAILLSVTLEEHGPALERTAELLRRWRGEQPLPFLVAGGRFFTPGRSVPGLDISGGDLHEVVQAMDERVSEIRKRTLR